MDFILKLPRISSAQPQTKYGRILIDLNEPMPAIGPAAKVFIKLMDLVLKLMNFVLKMMDFEVRSQDARTATALRDLLRALTPLGAA